MLKPYDFQRKAVAEALKLLSAGRRVLIVSPPGSGKTVMIADLAKKHVQKKRKVLIIAQRREILKQIYEHLLAIGIDRKFIGTIFPDSEAPADLRRPIQIASIATLMRRGLRPEADVTLLDEAHHAVAEGHAAILDDYLGGLTVGLTATPCRLDGRGLDDVFDEMVIAANYSDLINRKMLAKPRMYKARTEFEPNLSDLRTLMGDYTPGALEARVNSEPLVGNIVKDYIEKAKGRTAIVFAVSVKHSQHIVARFRAAGIAAEHLDGSTDLEERDAIVRRLESGKTKVVSNTAILHEGFDLPRTYAVILARPTMSLSLYLQQTGRALRVDGDLRPLILDHAKNWERFRAPEGDRPWTLQGVAREDGYGACPVRACPHCMAICPVSCKNCPECGEELREERGIPEEGNGELVEYTKELQRADEKRIRDWRDRSHPDWPDEWIEKCVEALTAYRSQA